MCIRIAKITINGRNFDSVSASNNIVNFKGSDVSIAATHVTPDGTMLLVHVPADKESGECMVSVTTNKGISNEVSFTVQSAQDGITRIISQLEEKIASGIYSKNAVNKMKEALKVIKEIQTLAGQQPPDTSAILDKIKNAMNFIIDGAGAGADIWDKLYILTGIRAMIVDSMITVEQSWMMIDRLKNLTPSNFAWIDMKTALLGTNNVVEKYYKQGISKAIDAMNDNIVVPLTTAGTKGVETQSIILSLVQSTVLYPQSLQGTLTGTLGADNETVQMIATAVVQANGQMANGDYAGALQIISVVWNYLEHKNALPGQGCFCFAYFGDIKGGEPINAQVKHEIYYDNKEPSGWKIKFSARDGANESFEVTDTDEIEAKCSGQKLVWSAMEDAKKCASVEAITITDQTVVTNNGWTINGSAVSAKFENNKNTVVDYLMPVLAGDITSSIDEMIIEIKGTRIHIPDTDVFRANAVITVRTPTDADYNETDWVKEYSDEFADYRVWIKVTASLGALDEVKKQNGCGCEILPVWVVGDKIDFADKNNKKPDWYVPEFFAVNAPQTFIFSGYADKDGLSLDCSGGKWECGGFSEEMVLPDTMRYDWQIKAQPGGGEFRYGPRSSESIYIATQPSKEEKDIKFEVEIGNTGRQENDEKLQAKDRKATAVLVDVIADAVPEDLELKDGAYVIVNDNDTNLDNIYDWSQNPVISVAGSPNELDLISLEVKIEPLIDKAVVKLDIANLQKIRLWEDAVKTKEFPKEAIGREWRVKNKKIEYTTTGNDWTPLPKKLFIEGIEAGQSWKDTEIKLTYVPKPGFKFADKAMLTILDAEIDAENLPDETEETIGKYVKNNSDDDDKDEIIDNKDQQVADIALDPPINGDDDLVSYEIQCLPYIKGASVTLELKKYDATDNLGNISVWLKNTKEELLIEDTGSVSWVQGVDVMPGVIWVEGRGISRMPMDSALKVTYFAPKICDDEVKSTTLDIVLMKGEVESVTGRGALGEPDEVLQKAGFGAESLFVSNPTPYVKLEELTVNNVRQNAEGKFIADMNLAGYTTFALSDMVPNGEADLTEAKVEVAGVEVATILMEKIDEESSILRPYARKFIFSQQLTAVTVTAFDAPIVIKVTEPAFGNTGWDAATFRILASRHKRIASDPVYTVDTYFMENKLSQPLKVKINLGASRSIDELLLAGDDAISVLSKRTFGDMTKPSVSYQAGLSIKDDGTYVISDQEEVLFIELISIDNLGLDPGQKGFFTAKTLVSDLYNDIVVLKFEETEAGSSVYESFMVSLSMDVMAGIDVSKADTIPVELWKSFWDTETEKTAYIITETAINSLVFRKDEEISIKIEYLSGLNIYHKDVMRIKLTNLEIEELSIDLMETGYNTMMFSTQNIYPPIPLENDYADAWFHGPWEVTEIVHVDGSKITPYTPFMFKVYGPEEVLLNGNFNGDIFDNEHELVKTGDSVFVSGEDVPGVFTAGNLTGVEQFGAGHVTNAQFVWGYLKGKEPATHLESNSAESYIKTAEALMDVLKEVGYTLRMQRYGIDPGSSYFKKPYVSAGADDPSIKFVKVIWEDFFGGEETFDMELREEALKKLTENITGFIPVDIYNTPDALYYNCKEVRKIYTTGSRFLIGHWEPPVEGQDHKLDYATQTQNVTQILHFNTGMGWANTLRAPITDLKNIYTKRKNGIITEAQALEQLFEWITTSGFLSSAEVSALEDEAERLKDKGIAFQTLIAQKKKWYKMVDIISMATSYGLNKDVSAIDFFLSYDIASGEGFQLFGIDALNDVIATEAGNIFAKKLVDANYDIRNWGNLYAELTYGFEEARRNFLRHPLNAQEEGSRKIILNAFMNMMLSLEQIKVKPPAGARELILWQSTLGIILHKNLNVISNQNHRDIFVRKLGDHLMTPQRYEIPEDTKITENLSFKVTKADMEALNQITEVLSLLIN